MHSCRIAIIKKKMKIESVDKDGEKRKPFHSVGGNLNWYRHSGKLYGGSFKNSNKLLFDPENLLLNI